MQLLNAEYWFLQLVFHEFHCVFIVDGQDMQYKKVNWFLKCQVSYVLGCNYKNIRLTFYYK